MLIIESKKYIIPVLNTFVLIHGEDIVGYWNKIDNSFILIDNINHFTNSRHIKIKNTVYINKEYYLDYNHEEDKIDFKKTVKEKILIYEGKLSYNLTKNWNLTHVDNRK